MSQSLFLSNRHHPVTDSVQPFLGEDLMRRFQRENAGILIFFGLAVVALFNLPIERLVQLVAESDPYHLILIAASFTILVIAIRRRQESLLETSVRAALVKDLEASTRIANQLDQLTSLLHSCFTIEEVSQIIPRFAQQLFPGYAGALYVFGNSPNLLDLVAEWGNTVPPATMFTTDHCWALHQGQRYLVSDPKTSVFCQHINHAKPYVCLPMMAHGEVLALLHVYSIGDAAVDLVATGPYQSLLYDFVEHIALPLSNLKLRDTLRQQSIRDPLTGLFNRRYLDEVLTTETERARRTLEPVSLIMFDIDNFRAFNDIYGHEAGDAILQALGRLFHRHTRGGDLCFRIGGDEFAVIFAGASPDLAQQHAEELCEAIRGLRIEFRSQTLGPGTISAGVATFPNHGESAFVVLQAAEDSLAQAKSEGRDRVILVA